MGKHESSERPVSKESANELTDEEEQIEIMNIQLSNLICVNVSW